MKKISLLMILAIIITLPLTAYADCLSKYDQAFKDKRTFRQFKNGNAQGKAKIGDYAIQIPMIGSTIGLVSCAIGCIVTGTLIPLATFAGGGIAVGAAIALAIPVKMAVDGSVDLNQVRKTLKQARQYSNEEELKNPLKKIVKRLKQANPELSTQYIVETIIAADKNESFCNDKLARFNNLDDLLIIE